jgi:hypothetical protein
MNASELSCPLSGPRFISTDHGIYVSNGLNWELQASSSGYVLKGISVPTATVGYAVGDNGLLLKTTNGGVLNIPYPNFSFPSVCCENAPVTFTNNTSSTYLFSWKVNNVLFSNAFSPSYTFPSAGNYSVTMIATNGPYADSLTRIITVVGVPDLNKTVSIVDSVICRTGFSLITVNNSDTGVVYYLYKIFNSSPIDSVNGNGTGASMNTGIITTTSNYVIKAKYQNVNCYGYFPDTIQIHVDHTHADFRMSLFNVLPGEPVDYYQYCKDADHYRWYFGSNANPTFDSTANPSGIVYQNPGPDNVNLAVWDDIGCYDSVTIAGAYCFNDTTTLLNTPNCWAFKYVGYDNAGLNNAIALKRNSEMLLGGVFYGGPYVYTTRTGRNWLLTEISDGGIYLADSTQKGVLRWTIFSHPDIYTSDGENLAGIKILPNGDIVACGKNESGWFHFNNLDSIYFQGGYFTLCIDSLGKYKWMDRLTIPNIANKYPNMNIDADALGNIYISGSCYPIQFTSSNFGNQTIPSAPNSSSPFFARITSDGQLVWMTYISQSTALSNEQYFRVVSIAVSPDGELYFTGTTLYLTLILHSTSGPDIAVSPSSGQGLMLGCYDISGMLRWVHCTNAVSYINENSDIHDIGNPGLGLAADSHGNVYLSGYMSANPIVFPSVNASSYTYSTNDSYVICSYNRNGDFRWATGANTTLGSLSGGTYSITFDRLDHIHSTNFFNAVTTSSNVIQFLSTNGTYTPINMNGPSVYLLDYDTMGVLYHASTEMGLTSTNSSQQIEMCLAVNDSGIVFAPGDVWVQSSLTNTNIANSMMNFFTLGSFVAKFSPPCAPTNIFYPQTTSTITQDSANENTFVISAFPDPAKDELNLNFSNIEGGKVTITLYDLSGEKISSLGTFILNPGKTLKTFSLSQFGLANGAYILDCTTDYATAKTMIIVAK